MCVDRSGARHGRDRRRRSITTWRSGRSSALIATVSLRSGATQARAEDTDPAPGQLGNGERAMGTLKTKDGTEIYYKDWSSGQAGVFSPGGPPPADGWEDQMFFLASHGYRVIGHDRRGHGRSSQP